MEPTLHGALEAVFGRGPASEVRAASRRPSSRPPSFRQPATLSSSRKGASPGDWTAFGRATQRLTDILGRPRAPGDAPEPTRDDADSAGRTSRQAGPEPDPAAGAAGTGHRRGNPRRQGGSAGGAGRAGTAAAARLRCAPAEAGSGRRRDCYRRLLGPGGGPIYGDQRTLRAWARVRATGDRYDRRTRDGRLGPRLTTEESSMSHALAEKSCTPCRGGIPPLTTEQALRYPAQAPNWALLHDGRRSSALTGSKIPRGARLRSAGGRARRGRGPSSRDRLWLGLCHGLAADQEDQGPARE